MGHALTSPSQPTATLTGRRGHHGREHERPRAASCCCLGAGPAGSSCKRVPDRQASARSRAEACDRSRRVPRSWLRVRLDGRSARLCSRPVDHRPSAGRRSDVGAESVLQPLRSEDRTSWRSTPAPRRWSCRSRRCDVGAAASRGPDAGSSRADATPRTDVVRLATTSVCSRSPHRACRPSSPPLRWAAGGCR
jgi:hypothetical protein